MSAGSKLILSFQDKMSEKTQPATQSLKSLLSRIGVLDQEVENTCSSNSNRHPVRVISIQLLWLFHSRPKKKQ